MTMGSGEKRHSSESWNLFAFGGKRESSLRWNDDGERGKTSFQRKLESLCLRREAGIQLALE
jgi:hypothetical protein